MDFLINNGSADLSFCDQEKYNNSNCTEIQYNDYLDKYSGKPIYDFYNNSNKIRYEFDIKNTTYIYIYYLRGFSFQKFWCQIGNYDLGIKISSLVAIAIFLLLLIFDLFCNKYFIKLRLVYYIIISGYMIFYIILRIFIILYVYLLIYSFIVINSSPKTYVFADFPKDGENEDPIIQEWKENKTRIYKYYLFFL